MWTQAQQSDQGAKIALHCQMKNHAHVRYHPPEKMPVEARKEDSRGDEFHEEYLASLHGLV
jgi:hypothetical protein